MRDFVAAAGVGETLVYNRLVADLMALDGVLDVTLELYPQPPQTTPPTPPTPPTTSRHRNLQPSATLRPTVDPAQGGALAVEVGGQLVALDVAVTVQLLGAGALGDLTVDLEEVRQEIAARLGDSVPALPALSAEGLLGLLTATDTWRATALSFTLELVDAGVRINREFTAGMPALHLSPLERPWVRRLTLSQAPVTP